jgi:flagellin
MSISIQTNVTSLMAQENLSVNQLFESRTIQRLTSGFRINSSGDDAAGLAVANQYRADIAELTQGVQNASNGLTQLQIVDGGLNNVSQMLDRMKTLAAESASGTFTGDRTTLNTEYQKLITEITRQASNINLNAGGTFNSNLNVYIGGGRTSTLAGSTQINIDLSGSSSAVDAASLGLSSTSVIGGGTTSATRTWYSTRRQCPAARASLLITRTRPAPFNPRP